MSKKASAIAAIRRRISASASWPIDRFAALARVPAETSFLIGAAIPADLPRGFAIARY